jgi:hypothetical protein
MSKALADGHRVTRWQRVVELKSSDARLNTIMKAGIKCPKCGKQGRFMAAANLVKHARPFVETRYCELGAT